MENWADLTERALGFFTVAVNLFVFGFAFEAFRSTRRRSCLFISLSAVIAVILLLLPEVMRWPVTEADQWRDYFIYSALGGLDILLWGIGAILLIRDFRSALSSSDRGDPESDQIS